MAFLSSTSRAADPYSQRSTFRADQDDFQAVVFCGYGESLYPLTQGENALPKALLPIGDEVMIDRVLAWVEDSGIKEVLILCPDNQTSTISEHIRLSWPSSGRAQEGHPASTKKRAPQPNSSKSGSRQPGDISPLIIEVHSLNEREERETLDGGAGAGGEKAGLALGAGKGFHSSMKGISPSQLRTAGPSGMGDDSDEDDNGLIGLGQVTTVGTGRIIRRWRDWLRSDFVILPCDLTPPSTIALSSLLNRHRSQSGSLLTSLWYEKGESELKDPDGPESVLVAYDKATTELLMIQPLEELEDELSIRMTLLAQHPTLSMTTRLQDAHVYAFKRSVLDLIMTRDPRDLESLREDFIPWLVKGGWQSALREKWNPVLNSKADPLEAAFALSTSARSASTSQHQSMSDSHDFSQVTSANATRPSSPRTPGQSLLDFKGSLANGGVGRKRNKDDARRLRSNIVIAKQPVVEAPVMTAGKGDKGKAVAAVPTEDALIRGNSVASYWTLCREYLRTMPPNLQNLPLKNQAPGTVSELPSNIDPKAQVSADSLLPSSSRVGERSSIKKSLIGRHCVIGKNVRISNAVIWDFVNIADGAKIDGSIICNNVRVGEKAQVTGCEIGSGYEVESDAVLKGEKLLPGDDA